MAVGYYAKKHGIPFTIYEASNQVGGNCSTFKRGEFLFDSGAHRFHDKNPQVTQEILGLMKEDILKISVPSQIYHQGRFIDFPLSPLDLMKKLGFVTFTKSGLDFLWARLQRGPIDNFERFAIHQYGKEMASRFLLNYSTKLWGLPCAQLSIEVSGKRMKGLDLKTFVKETLLGEKAKTEHLDGTFYYPRYGYGMITQKLADVCGYDNIRLNSRITKIRHRQGRIQEVELNNEQEQKCERVINTLPLSLFLKIMEPAPPEDIQRIARSMKFRHVLLAAIMLNKPSITGNGSVYFPDDEFPFTRVYEPKNRSKYMAPENKTSLMVEIPCAYDDAVWTMEEQKLLEIVKEKFKKIGWIEEKDVLDAAVYRLHNAYPVLELGFEEKIASVTGYLSTFPNLHLSGRGGKFVYTWLHDMIQFGKDIIEDILDESKERLQTEPV